MQIQKAICLVALLSSVLSFRVKAQDPDVFQRGEISTTDNHTGTVWLRLLSAPDSNQNYGVAVATFAPGAKLDWHIHPGGQILLIIKGTGYYQERGKPIQIVHKGDVIKCAPGVEHWHGAAPDSEFAYIAIGTATKGGTIWGKRVTEEEYHKIN